MGEHRDNAMVIRTFGAGMNEPVQPGGRQKQLQCEKQPNAEYRPRSAGFCVAQRNQVSQHFHGYRTDKSHFDTGPASLFFAKYSGHPISRSSAFAPRTACIIFSNALFGKSFR
jgi:hypothetical protein